VIQFFNLSLENGLLFDFFLFCKDSIRIAPPLVMSDEQAGEMCGMIIHTLDQTGK
jgi:adenosylmethionine-8-amino-7-oxononanoate aminotransferase